MIPSVPSTSKLLTIISYPWSDGQPINTMKVNRSYITSEDDSKITWAKNGAAAYAVVNKDKLNSFGEAPGYHIFPSAPTSLTHTP